MTVNSFMRSTTGSNFIKLFVSDLPAYYENLWIAAVKCFIGLAPGACTIKLFTAVIVTVS